ncbi:Iron-sulfur clusters transporter atm1, mitochondrial [Ascosphaera atra]|nr:Iron-sulfur clusters transporter atm1, mitochondrial [Ascosphaera atra]
MPEVSNKEQRKADLAIAKEMMKYLWPKGDWGAKTRVALALSLLVGGKILNVEVPFYFKSIVDSMNIDFAAVGGTAWTVGGAMIIACMLPLRPCEGENAILHADILNSRWHHENRSYIVSRDA